MSTSFIAPHNARTDALSIKAMITRYVAVVLVIAALIIIGRAISLSEATSLEGINELINVAGRQRMLSQRLAKEAYIFHINRTSADASEHLEHLDETLTRWVSVQAQLVSQVDTLPFSQDYLEQIRSGFAEAQPHHEGMIAALACVTRELSAGSGDCPEPNTVYLGLLDSESDAFLSNMDAIVNSYSAAADAAQRQLQLTEIGIAGIILGLLGVISVYIFRPAVQQIRASFRALTEAQGQLQQVNASLEARVRERTEALEKTNNTLQTTNEDLLNFTSIVTHDLRSPIAGIKGFLKEVRTDFAALGPIFEAGSLQEPDEEARAAFEAYIPDALNAMQDAVEKSERLLRGIMDIARDRNRRYNMETLDTSVVVETVLSSLAFDIQSHGVNINLAHGFPKIAADALAFEQIMSNLIGNSIKYRHPDRPVQIDISWANRDDWTTISVRDNGRGIPEEEQARVFQLFRRGSNAEAVEGMGMGLYYVRNLARRHGGEMWFESSVDVGSTFSFSMPLAGTGHSPIRPTDTLEMRTAERYEHTLAPV